MRTLERPRQRAKSTPAITDRPPTRHFQRRMVPIGDYDPQGDMNALAKRILDAICHNRARHATGSFVLGDWEKKVYVLSDGSNTTGALIDAHMSWYVGSYAMGRDARCRGVPLPSLQDILDDLEAHFSGLLIVPA